MAASLPFIDLGAQRARIGAAMDEAILRVVNHGAYILGPEVAALETELAAFCGASHVISCANGTDALAMVLMAKGIRPGDAVVCPSFTFAATAEVVAWFGATPVFADVVEDSFNLDPASLELAVATACAHLRAGGRRVRRHRRRRSADARDLPGRTRLPVRRHRRGVDARIGRRVAGDHG